MMLAGLTLCAGTGGWRAWAQGPRPLDIPAAALAGSGEPEAAFEARIAWQQAREPEAYRAFRQRFLALFNGQDMARVTEIAAPALREPTAAERMVSFLMSLKTDNGAIDSLRFKYFDTRNQRGERVDLAVYALRFANGSRWEFRVGLDGQGGMTRYIVTDANLNEDLPLADARTVLRLPFASGEQWYVLWGGDSAEQNYHVTVRSQKNAFDLLIRNPWSGRNYRSDGRANQDYYAFGRPILAPVDGRVVTVIDGVADNVPGAMNPRQLIGNAVIIRTVANEYVLLAHLMNGSIAVREGQAVRAGQRLGSCGNSGNSSEPHLHLQVMDGPSMRDATGLKAYFGRLTVNGRSIATHYSPVQGNFIQRD